MKEEIKEILKKIKSVSDFDDYVDFIGTEFKPLLDYITNLQEENEKVHKELDYADNYNIYLISKIDKAIEYIEEHIKYECDDTFNGMSFYSYHLYDFKKDDLLNILKGE